MRFGTGTPTRMVFAPACNPPSRSRFTRRPRPFSNREASWTEAGGPRRRKAPFALPQRQPAPNRAGALVPGLEPDLGARRRLDHPLELGEVGGRLVVAPPRRRALFDAALQLARHRLELPADEAHAVGQVQLDLQLTHRLPL